MITLSVPEIFEAFGGRVALAKAVGVPPTTAQYWMEKGRIPAWRMPAIELAAAQSGVSLTPKKRKRAA